MIKKETTYNSFKTVYLLKHWVAFCFLLFLVAKPMITVTALFVDVRYEFIDNFEKETTEEKEDVVENAEEEKLYTTIVLSIDNYLEQSLSYVTTQKHFLDFKPDIYLLPPRL